jgi:hypothetical protein
MKGCDARKYLVELTLLLEDVKFQADKYVMFARVHTADICEAIV